MKPYDQPASSASLRLALDEYSKNYGHADSHELHQASLKEVIDGLLQIERKHIASKRFGKGNLKSRLMGLITFVDRYSAAIDCLVQTCSGFVVNPAALIWGLLRILIEVWNLNQLLASGELTDFADDFFGESIFHESLWALGGSQCRTFAIY